MSEETVNKGRARRATTPDGPYLDRPSSEKASTIHWSVSPHSDVVCDLTSHTAAFARTFISVRHAMKAARNTRGLNRHTNTPNRSPSTPGPHGPGQPPNQGDVPANPSPALQRPHHPTSTATCGATEPRTALSP
jgi:hypothetical protein